MSVFDSSRKKEQQNITQADLALIKRQPLLLDSSVDVALADFSSTPFDGNDKVNID